MVIQSIEDTALGSTPASRLDCTEPITRLTIQEKDVLTVIAKAQMIEQNTINRYLYHLDALLALQAEQLQLFS